MRKTAQTSRTGYEANTVSHAFQHVKQILAVDLATAWNLAYQNVNTILGPLPWEVPGIRYTVFADVDSNIRNYGFGHILLRYLVLGGATRCCNITGGARRRVLGGLVTTGAYIHPPHLAVVCQGKHVTPAVAARAGALVAAT